MVFSSSVFIFMFLPLSLVSYYISGKKIKNYILLLASLFFYAWGGMNYLKVLIISILINYIFGLLVDKTIDKKHLRMFFLILGIILNLALLFYYKYYDFFLENINIQYEFRVKKNSITYRNIIFYLSRYVLYNRYL